MRIPEQPTPGQLIQLLAQSSNDIGQWAVKVEQARSDFTKAQKKHKRELAAAMFRYGEEKNATLTKARAELDNAVIDAEEIMDVAEAKYKLMQAELDGMETAFVALRKIAEIRKTEMRTFGD